MSLRILIAAALIAAVAWSAESLAAADAAAPNLSSVVAASAAAAARATPAPAATAEATCQDFAEPVYSASVPLLGISMRSTIDGDVAYVGCFDGGLRIVDLAGLRQIASVLIGGQTYGSVRSGSCLVVGTYTTTGQGLRVFDVSDPSAPILETTTGPTDCSFFAVSGDYLYVACCFQGLGIFDISHLPDLQLVTYFPTEHEALGLVVRGDVVYLLDSTIAGSQTRLHAIDIADPHHPQELGSVGFGGYGVGLTLAGSFAYAACYWGSTQIIDVSDPHHPSLSGSLNDGSGFDVAHVGNKLYVANIDAGTTVYNINFNGSGSFEGSLMPLPGGLVYGISLSGDYAYAANGSAGLGIALQACRLRRLFVGTEGSDALGDGTQAAPYLTIARAVDEAVDADSVIVLPGVYHETVDPKGKKILVGSRYALEPDTALISATVIDGERARRCAEFLGGEDTTTVLCGLTLTRAFAGAGAGVLIAPGAQPMLRNLRIHDCFVTEAGGGIACGGPEPGGAAGLWLEDAVLERNAAPEGGALWLAPGSTAVLRRVALRGNWAGGGAGASVGAGGRLEAHGTEITLNQAARGPAIHQNGSGVTCLLDHATVAANSASDPDGAALTGGPAGTITFTSGILWGNTPNEASVPAAEPAGSLAIDYSDVQDGPARLLGPVVWGPENIAADPRFCDAAAGQFPLMRGSPCEHAGEGGTAMGARTVFCSATAMEAPPRPPQLGTPFPNPFNPVVTIPLLTDRPGRARLSIYDARGRQVALLWDGDLPAGAHALVWRGRDDRGRPAPSGVYFGRLQTRSGAWTRRLVLTR
jgi:hypothetical protein